MNTQKPYYSTQSHLDELQTILKQMESINMDTTKIKRDIETSSLQVTAFAQMDENNKKFNEQFSNK
jgi:hypothetical protein